MGDEDLRGISRRMSTWLLDLISFLSDTDSALDLVLDLVQVLFQVLRFMFCILHMASRQQTTLGVLLAFLGLLLLTAPNKLMVPPLFAVVGVKGMILLDDLFGLQTSRIPG